MSTVGVFRCILICRYRSAGTIPGIRIRQGGISDPEYSINVGIQNLADCLSAAQVENPIDMEHIKLALQGYNFGNGSKCFIG